MDRDAWIICARALNPEKFWLLLAEYKCPREMLRFCQRYTQSSLEAGKSLALDFGLEWVCSYDKEYPKSLNTMTGRPPVLLVAGNVSCLNNPTISCVGARNCSSATSDFITEVVKYCEKFSIVSGLAVGVDAAAHEASIERGTVAVIAGGLDSIYPEINLPLYKRILANSGAAISSSPLRTPFAPRSFPYRNKIIAAYSKIFLVAEAGLQSGSLMAANFAGTFGKEVFVMPGHPRDPRSKGSNLLIQNGANLLQDPTDLDSYLDK